MTTVQKQATTPTPTRLATAIPRLLTASEAAATRGEHELARVFARKAAEASSQLHQLSLRHAIDTATTKRRAGRGRR